MSVQLRDGVIEEARAWAEEDTFEITKAGLTDTIERAQAGDDAAIQELNDAFQGPLEFGTAGLRGVMGPGPHRMNLTVVSRAAAGIASYLSDQVGSARVVIGFDGRYHSRDFAERSAQIFTAAGHDVSIMPLLWPTPVLAYAVRALDADCGIMVTASHNPAQDNGYKVYLGARATDEHGRGVQIVPPADAQIAEHIAAVGPLSSIERAQDGWRVLPEEFVDEYVKAIVPVTHISHGGETNPAARNVRIVHTAMHGVGHTTMQAAFGAAGFTDVHSVTEQAVADPDFPTVPFPNPEEPGAIDRALELARSVDADLVIANDPDADRCAVAVVDEHRGDWRMLHGDELGVLLATYLIKYRGVSGTLANSIVSSRALGSVANEAGLTWRQTLTGFKWIARSEGIAFGYEEAIGYCVLPEVVKDKDGISAALAIAQLAAILKAEGSSLMRLLDALAERHGLYLTDQVSIRVDDASRISEMMHTLRTSPPAELLGARVSVQDLAQGSPESTGLPPTDGVLLLSEDDTRVIVRPSGTEPKLKAYLEVVQPVQGDVSAARAKAAARMAGLRSQVREALGVS